MIKKNIKIKSHKQLLDLFNRGENLYYINEPIIEAKGKKVKVGSNDKFFTPWLPVVFY